MLASRNRERDATAAERNLYSLFRSMARLAGGEVDGSGPVSRHHAFPTNPMFKGAWATRLGNDEAEPAIDDTIAWFRSRGAPYFFWWTGPTTTPADLPARLAARGLLSMEGQQAALAPGIKQAATGAPIMTLDLDGADWSALSRVPSRFAISEAHTDADLEAFKHVFVATYEIPEWAGKAWVEATRSFGIGRAPWRIFVGRLDGVPVATSLLHIGDDTASVYAVATLPSAQRKGIGAAITLAPLFLARKEGSRQAAIFSTEMGYPVYRRIGFADTGLTLNRFLWRAG